MTQPKLPTSACVFAYGTWGPRLSWTYTGIEPCCSASYSRNETAAVPTGHRLTAPASMCTRQHGEVPSFEEVSLQCMQGGKFACLYLVPWRLWRAACMLARWSSVSSEPTKASSADSGDGPIPQGAGREVSSCTASLATVAARFVPCGVLPGGRRHKGWPDASKPGVWGYR